jgi:hypothetical protein
VLAGFALAAITLRLDTLATGWAALAGVAPLLTFVDRLTFTGADTVERLGLTGEQPRVAAVLTGIASATVLSVAGRRRDDAGLVLLGVAVGALGVVASWSGQHIDGGTTLVGLATVFLLVELVAYATRYDDFWRVPTDIVAQVCEWAAGIATVVAAFPVLIAPASTGTHSHAALAALVLGVGWLAADRRRGQQGLAFAGAAIATCIASSVALVTDVDALLAVTLTVIAAVAVFSGHRAGSVVAVLAAVWAPVVALESTPALIAVGAAGSLVLAEAAARRAAVGAALREAAGAVTPDTSGQWTWLRTSGPASRDSRWVWIPETAERRGEWASVPTSRLSAPVPGEHAPDGEWVWLPLSAPGAGDSARRADIVEQWAWLMTLVALVPGGLAMIGYIADTGRSAAGLVGGAVLATLVAVVADRGPVRGELPLGTLARVGAVSVLAGTADLPAHEVAWVALAVAVLSIAEALRRRDPVIALGASVAVPMTVGALARAAGLSMSTTGVVLAVAAAVIAGLGALAGRRWAIPVVAAVALSAGAGLALAAPDPSAFADALMITSGIAMAVSVERGRLDGVLLSGLTLTAGIWIRLADAGMTASEPYLVPVSLLLLGAGLRARSTGTSSWIAYGPVVALLGGAALAERVTGGPGWHALVAGSVGILAVVAGGSRRLAAPLFLGTALLVALVGYETLAITAEMPTWTWLALGGATLLSAGVAMERHDLGPLETGRRLVDVVDEHFA